MTQFLGTLWYVLIFTPAIFWFLLIRKFNKKYKSKFPAIVYSIIYLVPLFGHLFLSWSFVKDLAEAQQSNKISPLKTYLIYLALPYLFMLCGLYIFIFVGGLLTSIGIPLMGPLALLATYIPYISFIWLAWGFWQLKKIISNTN